MRHCFLLAVLPIVVLSLLGCPDEAPQTPTLDTSGGGPADASAVPDGGAMSPDLLAPLDEGTPVGDDGAADTADDVGGDVGPVQPADCATNPGGAYCPCAADSQCESALCLESGGGKVCAAPCDGGCQEGWVCLDMGPPGAGADASLVCVHRQMRLCMPCEQDSDCDVAGFDGLDKCASYGSVGSFCATTCSGDADCPAGYGCDNSFCRLDQGVCECAPLHIGLGATTACQGANEIGTCPGHRACAADGLTVCDAQVPVAEYCDGKDNDCNGQTDEIPDGPCSLTNSFGTCEGVQSCTDGETVCSATDPAEEGCDGVDNDCDGQTDEGFDDLDGDGAADCVDEDKDGDGTADVVDNCVAVANDQLDTDGDGKGDACDPDDDGDGALDEDDCNPTNAQVYPFAPEVCDGLDNDCDQAIDEKACDDGNACTDDVCDPQSGCSNPFNQTPCSDGNPCTQQDACDGGGCVGQFVVCDDGNPCTDEACDPSGGCLSSANTSPCEDGNLCTENDFCSGKVCLPGNFVACQDGGQCALYTCNPTTGCTPTFLESPCNDQNPCTVGDMCIAGKCLGESKVCDDQNPCTDDLCDPDAGGCTTLPASGASCDDGSTCTTNDVCDAGACVGQDTGCDCEVDLDCAAFEDGNLCNGTLVCDTSSAPFRCVVKASSVVACVLPDSVDEGCAQATCDPETGGCSVALAADGVSCDDNNICTTADTCVAGKCSGQALVCDDDNPCTTGSCEVGGAGCVYTPVAGFKLCDDGSACTLNDACQSGFCVGTSTLICEDGNPCTDDSCDAEAGCVFLPNTNPCADIDACTINTLCQQGVCVGTPPPCDDQNACNGLESCDSGTGCVSGTPLVCDDGVACTVDQCAPSTGCTFTPDDGACDDGEACTGVEVCDPSAGCLATPPDDGTDCNDNNACTLADACVAGSCVGALADCDDHNPCTVDSCNPVTGCLNTPVAGFKICDDGNACTLNDACQSGFCQGTLDQVCQDDNPCTDDGCDPKSGCVFAFNTVSCDDGKACTVQDACFEGTCQGTSAACDDGNPCNGIESCNADLGCQPGPVPTCNDGVPCTADSCVDSVGCKHVTQNQACDDGVFCNGAEVCDADAGCVATPLPDATACNDGLTCTVDDACLASVCVGTEKPCDDGNVCTIDFCEEPSGCTSTVVSGFKVCDDSDPCTTDDQCQAGFCKGDPTVTCDDGDPCTDDACVPGQGCAHTPNTASCDDGDSCTVGDVCDAGVCAGAAMDCGALDSACTTGVCEAGTCVAAPQAGICNDNDPCTDNDVCSAGTCMGVPKDCSALDGPCEVGACEAGVCVVQSVSCAPSSVRLNTPSGSVIVTGGAGHGVIGSAGQGQPAAWLKNAGGHQIHLGFHAR